MLNFKSDNISGVHPLIFKAMEDANEGFAGSYGGDKQTEKLNQILNQVFEREVTAFFATTGTASNCLALSAICPSFGTVLCSSESHINTKEANSLGFFNSGATLTPVSDSTGKVSVERMEEYIVHARGMNPHETQAFAVSVTEATESGTLYTVDEVKRISEYAHANGLKVHMDGSRLANALAAMNCTPAEITWKAGVDVLSLGGTKNGCMLAELIIFFNKDDTKYFNSILKRSGQIVSKSRFFAAQLCAYFENDLWISNARNANAMAKRISEILLKVPGSSLITPTQANEVFVNLPTDFAKKLKEKGVDFGVWDVDFTQFRFLGAWSTTEEQINKLDSIVESLIH